ncbi:MAG TPA: NADH-quinone oxidoreductase subunit C [Alphaproteobacteria bacterium]|nr:NADH-quinone oxidoreductase subunit C [Alphaproteobacteria bacterium]
MENLQDFGRYVSLHFAKQDIVECEVSFDCLSLTVLRAALGRVAAFLRDDAACRFTQLTDITAVHYPQNAEEFTLVYHLAAPMLNRRIRLKMQTARDVAVSSLCSVFPNAAWYEREIREMFGVSFENHPDLRRLLTDDALAGFPLTKDFPAAGRDRLLYDESGECFVLEEKVPEPQKNLIAVNLAGEE